jgi:hypothetical protein
MAYDSSEYDHEEQVNNPDGIPIVTRLMQITNTSTTGALLKKVGDLCASPSKPEQPDLSSPPIDKDEAMDSLANILSATGRLLQIISR